MTPIPGSKHRTECIRCGECCLRSSPSLQVTDISRVINGPIRRSDLYTLRVGELVQDNIRGGLKRTEEELIKVREREETGACIFYDDPGKQCTIYEGRPIQCAAMKCWDERDFMQAYREPKAARRDLFHDENLLRLMASHEERCGYALLERDVRDIETIGEKAVRKILATLKVDHDIRSLTREKLGIDFDELDLIFGRPLIKTISMFGLKVVREPDGSFFLTVSDRFPHP